MFNNDHTGDPFASQRPAGSPIPLLGGESPIKHVIYIQKEDKTYDQVFGDLRGTNADPRLLQYGAEVTPNLHALALRFGVFDNYYDDGMSSSDGKNWAMSANDNDFNEKMWRQGYSKRSQFGIDAGTDPMDLSPGGYLWDRADQAHITIGTMASLAAGRFETGGFSSLLTRLRAQVPSHLPMSG